MQTRAVWSAPGRAWLQTESVSVPGPGEVLVRTLHSAVSRGTEALVLRGGVPPGQYDRMRAPFQAGDFPGPVKYGYLNVGVVERGPEQLVGRTVFCLYPHQERFVVPVAAVFPVPAGVPAARAILAGAVETAVNALWDARPLVGDRITVIGAGMIGCSVALLAHAIPGVSVQLVDTDPTRAGVAATLGVEFCSSELARAERDIVVHASGQPSGLVRALDLVRTDGTVIELSWYGDREVTLPLGGDFHSRRLSIRASQVGSVSPHRATTRTTSDRLALSLMLLRETAFDALVTGACRFDELPDVLPRLADGTLPALCHRVDYSDRGD